MQACTAYGEDAPEETKYGEDCTMPPEGQRQMSIEGHSAFASEALDLPILKEKPGAS